MGLFGTKEKNYEEEIALLNERQTELSKETTKNKGDIIAFSMDFGEYKRLNDDKFDEVWDFLKNINSSMTELKKWKEEQERENSATKKAKNELPDTLTYKEVADSLNDFTYLDQTSFKYYLYENGILDLKINKIRNTYNISGKFNSSTSEIKQYIHISDGIITFDKSVLEYLMKNPKDLQDSIYRYVRKQRCFNEAKQHLSEIETKNYQKEICKICGISNDGNFDGNKWAKIYKKYSINHKDWLNKYCKWRDDYTEQHPGLRYKPSKITYLVQIAGDGDVLLKIACELFVN
jgi:hypothetical protein